MKIGQDIYGPYMRGAGHRIYLKDGAGSNNRLTGMAAGLLFVTLYPTGQPGLSPLDLWKQQHPQVRRTYLDRAALLLEMLDGLED